MDGRGAFPESHPRWAGVMTGSWVDNTVEMEVLQRADAVLFAGADAMMAHVPWSSPLPVCELVARPEHLSFTADPEVRVDGDLKDSIAQLTTAGDGFSEAELAEIDAAVEPHFARPPQARLAAQDVIETARELMPPEECCSRRPGSTSPFSSACGRSTIRRATAAPAAAAPWG